MAAVRDLCAFHRPTEGGKATPSPKFLFDVSQDSFHQAEDQFLKELTEYTKKQFFKVLSPHLPLLVSGWVRGVPFSFLPF